MPGYGGIGRALILLENQQGYFWNNETIAAGSPSVAWQLNRTRGNFYPWGSSVEVHFSGAPGAFQCDVQIADTDNPLNYVSIGSITAVNANSTGRLDNLTTWGKCVRLLMVSLTNAVATTATLTR